MVGPTTSLRHIKLEVPCTRLAGLRNLFRRDGWQDSSNRINSGSLSSFSAPPLSFTVLVNFSFAPRKTLHDVTSLECDFGLPQLHGCNLVTNGLCCHMIDLSFFFRSTTRPSRTKLRASLTAIFRNFIAGFLMSFRRFLGLQRRRNTSNSSSRMLLGYHRQWGYRSQC